MTNKYHHQLQKADYFEKNLDKEINIINKENDLH